MKTRAAANQIAFRYRSADSATGVTRETLKRVAEKLGVDETQAIHLALREIAVKLLPQYQADEGPLTAVQVRQIKKMVPQGKKRSVRSSLFEVTPA
jgi:antitoxin component of RelBE/YafQ-DinJ toxin-antitoxin module